MTRRTDKEFLGRGQTARQEWAVTRACRDLMHRGQVAVAVDARTGGLCYYPGCQWKIISYPHALRWSDGGSHDAINRAGVCTIHREALNDRHDPSGEARVYLQEWLQRWYAEHEGMTAAEWWARAVRPAKGEVRTG